MQPANTEIRHKILPHHVFQLQCMLDTFTVSRSWSMSALRGHVLMPPAQGFATSTGCRPISRPRHDEICRAELRRKTFARTAFRSAIDIHNLLGVKGNRFSREPTILNPYQHAQWDPYTFHLGDDSD
ncbi:hypothetical protein TSTA_126050 [Talaromyces stipitatus ATCC 10500]|uniref:Uncharacterized protein n=1 Tax=Talaromyces stipitatus (strain ATCC 10500 / CBS 375.48 / QM 6759 / NRRL 1006) TaxID=441959 RepID=B8MBA5_TALSN|nr:uncharacterized protein TSTA_126050 [Talaromyces stipitatus ATCC 10500]EED18894.1 hypothetical protein TSTA_126050 [Talaromyces stipitatus ATCC 10500]